VKPVEVAEPLPLLEAVVEELGVVDHYALQHPVTPPGRSGGTVLHSLPSYPVQMVCGEEQGPDLFGDDEISSLSWSTAFRQMPLRMTWWILWSQ
jgi:hypothetical protein